MSGFRLKIIISFLSALFALRNGQSQSPVYFSSGNFAAPNNWVQGTAALMGTVAGTNILTTTSNVTAGNAYYRFYSATSGGTTYEPNGGSDILVTLSSKTSLQVTGSGKAYYFNTPNTTDNYVFKTNGSGVPGSCAMFVMQVQGAIVSVSSVSQSPSTVFPGQNVTVTANLSGSFSTGQSVYLRYSTDNFATSTITEMAGSGTSYSSTITASSSLNTSGQTIQYYVFTSGNGITIAHADADLHTINLNNNGGTNYSYTVQLGWTSFADGNWNTAGTWTANATPSTSLSMGDVTISHNVTLNQNATASGLIVDVSKILTANNGSVLTTTGNVTINGTVTNAGTITISGGAWTFASGGKYQHNYTTTAGTIPTAIWSSGSTCEIIGYTTNTGTTGGLSQSFNNFIWNCTAQAADVSASGNLTTINGNFTISSTGAGTNAFQLSTTGSPILSIAGDYSQSGGIFQLAPTGASGNVTVNIAGNFFISAGSIRKTSGTSSGKIVFNKSSGTQTFNSTSGGINNNDINIDVGSGSSVNILVLNSNLVLRSGATLAVLQNSTFEMSTWVISGGTGGTFTLNAGGTVKIGSTAGITLSGGTGNVQTTNRAFNTGANYVYTGTTSQVTGNGLPSIVNSLIINNSSGVTLSAADVTVSSQLILTSGLLTLGTYNLILSASATVSGTPSASNMVVPTSTGEMRKVFIADGNFTFPVGDNTVTAEYSPAYINLAASGYSSAYIGIKLVNAKHPNMISSAADYLKRYWALSSSGLTNSSYSADFYYVDTDINGIETNIYGGFYNSAWTLLNATDAANNKISVTGQTSFGDYTGGEQNAFKYITTSTGNWSTISNWNYNCVPPSNAIVVINNNLTLDQTATVSTITINSGTTLTSQNGLSRILTVSSSGSFINNGTYTANDGKVAFAGSGAVSGIVTFNNVDISGAVDFGANSTINGTLLINAGGSVNTNAPFYAINSNLKYAADFQLASEWYANLSSGQGVPYNVIIDGGNVYMFTGAALPRYLRGALTINPGKTFSLSQTALGDLYIADDWNNNGTFNANSRAVYFNGTSAQNINTDAPFAYLYIDNTTSYNANFSVKYLTINSGKSLISQVSGAKTMTISADGSITNNGIFTANDGKVTFGGSTNTAINTVTGTMSFYNAEILANGVNFGTASTINNILQLNSTGYANINAPTYATGSTLKYYMNGHYDRRVEWSAQTGRGYPYHVWITNNTDINLGFESPGVQKECAGNLTIDAGSALYLDYNADDMTQSLIIKGDLFLNGSLSLSDIAGGDLEIYGNWNRTGTFTPKSRIVTFKGISNQSINNTTAFDFIKINNSGGAVVSLADNITASISASVESGAIFNLSTFVVSGTGTFENKTGGTIKIGSLLGITTAPTASGNVQTTTRLFRQDAMYHYIGASDQITGNGLQSPLYSGGKVIVELNSNLINLTPTAAINTNAGSELKIIQGMLIENGSNTRFYGSGDLTMAGGIYKFLTTEAGYPGTDNEYCPKLTGIYNLTGGIVELAAITNTTYQVLKGNRNYYNVKISGGSSGAGYKSVSTALTISNSLLITDATTIFDTKNYSVAGDGGLIMDGGRYRIGKQTNSQPELTGINTAYSITGGTVEFYGTNGTQQQLLRGNFGSSSSRIAYYNLDLNSNIANTSIANPGNINASESFSVRAGGTVNIFSPTVFRLDETDYIDGAGDVNVNLGAALLYGSPNGIKTSGTGINDGNIRISGTRNFSSSASYGFVSSGDMSSGAALPATVVNLYLFKTNATDVISINNTGVAVIGKTIFSKGILNTDISNLITFNDGATVHTNESGDNNVPGSASSFVKGPSKKIGNDYFTFPAGDIQGANYVWAPLGMDNSAGTIADAFTTQYNFKSASLDGFPTWNNGSSMGAGLDHVSGIEYWTLTRDIGTSVPSVSLYWKDALRSDIANNGSSYTQLSDLTVAHWNTSTSKWEDMGGDATISSVYPSGQISSTVAFPNYSPITFGSKTGKNPLPVTLTKFYGNCEKDGYHLIWTTESEINNDHFQIQKCPDNSCLINNEWVSIAKVAGAGNSNETQTYQFTDLGFVGSAYLRLKQFDFNGNICTSSAIFADCNKQGIENLSFYFNYNEKSVRIQVASAIPSDFKITLIDISGKIIRQNCYQTSSSMSDINIDVSDLATGLYFINISNGSSIFTNKLFLE